MSSSGTNQQPNSRHAPHVTQTTNTPVTITTVVTNNNSSHVSSDGSTSPPNEHSKALVEDVLQSHTPQHSDISLTSLSSGMTNNKHLTTSH